MSERNESCAERNCLFSPARTTERAGRSKKIGREGHRAERRTKGGKRDAREEATLRRWKNRVANSGGYRVAERRETLLLRRARGKKRREPRRSTRVAL